MVLLSSITRIAHLDREHLVRVADPLELVQPAVDELHGRRRSGKAPDRIRDEGLTGRSRVADPSGDVHCTAVHTRLAPQHVAGMDADVEAEPGVAGALVSADGALDRARSRREHGQHAISQRDALDVLSTALANRM